MLFCDQFKTWLIGTKKTRHLPDQLAVYTAWLAAEGCGLPLFIPSPSQISLASGSQKLGPYVRPRGSPISRYFMATDRISRYFKNGRSAHLYINGYPSAAGPVQTSESSLVIDQYSTTESPNQLATQYSTFLAEILSDIQLYVFFLLWNQWKN